jgi:integrase/recombinase XerC
MELVKGFIEFLGKEKNYSKHTILSYSNDLEHFSNFVLQELKSDPLTIDSKEIRFYIVSLKKLDFSARSINRKIACLKSFFKYLLLIDARSTNPTTAIRSQKVPKTLPTFYSNKEMDEILDLKNFPDTWEGHRDRLIILILFSTGIRKSELINLKYSNIDLSRKQIQIIGKGNKIRYVFLTNELIKDINTYRTMIPDDINVNTDYLLLTNKGNKLYPKFVYKVTNSYLSYVSKGRKRNPHSLRHSYATELMNEEVEINSIKESLGHSSLSSTEIYTHNSKSRLVNEYLTYHPRGGDAKRKKI